MKSFIRERRLFLIIFIVLIPLLFRPRLFGYDPVGYFSWVRSAVIDGNLDTTDEYHTFGNEEIAGPTITGYNHNPYAIGTSLMWSPYFLVAHLIENARAALTQSPQPTGYETFYVLLVSMGSMLYGFATVLILHSIGKRLFEEPVAKITALVGWLATPLVFYMYSHPTMAHAADAFVNALVILAWFVLRRSSAKHWFVLGLATGVAMLVRTQNALLIIIPVAELTRMLWQSIGAPQDSLRHSLKTISAYALGGLIGFLPQILTWRIVYGTWLELNPYAYSDAGHFIWGRLWIFRVLFSTDRGLFLWSPIVLFAVLGLIPLYRRNRRLAIFLAWSLASQTILISMWSAPTGASAFGARLLLNNMPLYIIGLAAFADWLKSRQWSTRALASTSGAFIIWNFLLIAQYATETIPRGGLFPIGDMIAGQFTVLPTQLGRIIEALLTRQ